MDFADLPAFALPLIAAMSAGGLIGLEREWRGRAAGLRTHILVCLASALLMEMAVSQGAWRFLPIAGAEIVADPTRMAHGVLTGIGFLCAGVIFRTGFSIHGLTTAASLWITAALGLAFGAGLFALGGAATVLTLAILIALRLISKRLPARTVVDVCITWRPNDDAGLKAVEAELERLDGRLKHTFHGLEPDGTRRVGYRVRAADPDLAALADRLSATAGVCAFTLDPRDD
ncbi:MAG TPA: MgtC/SapB family protein [Brevundimonas sp.]|jgi:putative Mg2+ transporter-C (MgtC) family protein|uniref:MgtC/SapB family protein n=1 Tax=Brevundimonas sp. TaxID=1871086 RepID=UPI002DEE9C61|nr:MgtC/SapB family protein [Brevundimonas sp.]